MCWRNWPLLGEEKLHLAHMYSWSPPAIRRRLMGLLSLEDEVELSEAVEILCVSAASGAWRLRQKVSLELKHIHDTKLPIFVIQPEKNMTVKWRNHTGCDMVNQLANTEKGEATLWRASTPDRSKRFTVWNPQEQGFAKAEREEQWGMNVYRACAVGQSYTLRESHNTLCPYPLTLCMSCGAVLGKAPTPSSPIP